MTVQFSDDDVYSFDFSISAFPQILNNRKAHSRMIGDIYDFICIQEHGTNRSKRPRSVKVQKSRFILSLYVVDYLLLNGGELGVYQFGFSTVVGMHLKQMLAARASSADLLTGLMQWPERLNTFLQSKSAHLTEAQVSACISECPFLSVVNASTDGRSLDMTEEQLIRARCWMWSNGYYTKTENQGYRFVPNNKLLSEKIYHGTIWVHRNEVKKPLFDELCIEKTDGFCREYPGAQVRATALDDACSERSFRKFLSALLNAKPLSTVGCAFPLKSIEEIESFSLPDAIRLKLDGRYLSVPAPYALDAVGKAISFFLEHSRHLLTSYAHVLFAARAASKSVNRYSFRNGIEHVLHPLSRDMGIKKWSVSQEIRVAHLLKKDTPKAPASEFFRRFRENEGLLELVHALYGAMQLIIGMLMAARQGELIDLPVDCLDESGEWIKLLSRKSGYGGLRNEDERPIPYIGMRIVRRIKAFHALLRRHGIEAPALVFAMPNTHGTFSVDHKKYNKAIDRFLDYIQTPLNSSGERYYIRQHQLRRLFALLFYLMPFYGGLDDLRWMLRHIDPRHLEHYITNAFPGSQLVSIRSEVLAIILRENENVLVDLRTFVKAQFDTTQIDLMTNEGFEQYIHFLKRKQSDGSLQVRPVYFDTPDGTRHTFAVTVFEVEDEV
ncbi:hypothetical protein SAMN05216466_10525 [Paraburkholderia phenazinium]|uniref:Phage integrase family protein n=1 Tax=Paraburkholderia phenazinium TaxID=60549 RepID=A0A1G7WS69_9BURK|nr:site-specific integrase [Paraburkholderia phenazinium]SDG74746.1 hypothetical protein SAMN05216466_10525 [Paraburkholderia phenazinium]